MMVEVLILVCLGTVFGIVAAFQIRWTWRRVWLEDTYSGIGFFFVMLAVFCGACAFALLTEPSTTIAARAWMVLPAGTLVVYSLELSAVLLGAGGRPRNRRRSIEGNRRKSANEPRAVHQTLPPNVRTLVIGAAAVAATLGALLIDWRGAVLAVPAAVVTHATLGAWAASREQLRRP